MTEQTDEGEYGPGGYLPPRAAKRARKIVLREQMGLRWPIASVVAGIAILAVTVPFVIGTSGPPDAPYVEVGPLQDVLPSADAVVDVAGTPVLLVRAAGALQGVVDPPAGARWCAASRRIESPDGTVWSTQGRLLAGDGRSLRPAAVTAYDGVVYVDPAGGGEPLEADPRQVEPACAGEGAGS